jgi:hypothetical protein
VEFSPDLLLNFSAHASCNEGIQDFESAIKEKSLMFKNLLMFFLSDYDTVHQLSVGSTCPGETVISCLDDPDTEIFSYTNYGNESVTAFFVVDSYNLQSGTFTLEWNLTIPTGIFIKKRCSTLPHPHNPH